jgi:hypothetical protein
MAVMIKAIAMRTTVTRGRLPGGRHRPVTSLHGA